MKRRIGGGDIGAHLHDDLTQPITEPVGQRRPSPTERRGLVPAVAEEDFGDLAVASERTRTSEDGLLQNVGCPVRLDGFVGIEARAELLRDPLGHLLESLVHAPEVHVESRLCHPSKLCDAPGRQGGVAVPVDRFENRLK